MCFTASEAAKYVLAVPFLDYSKDFLRRHLHMRSAHTTANNNGNCESPSTMSSP